jgi:hypothetical protein
VFSTDRTAQRLAALCLLTCFVAVCCMWPLGGVAHGALAVAAVSVAFAAISLLAPVTLMDRLHERGSVEDELGEGVASRSASTQPPWPE